MANARKKQAIYVDTVGTVTVDALRPLLVAFLITPNAADSRLIIKENVSGTIVIDVKIETIESRYISFEAFGGLNLNQSFEITTLQYIDSVVLYGFWGTPTNKAQGNIV